MLRILKKKDCLLLRYEANHINDASWIDEKLKKDGDVTLKGTFTFSPNLLIRNSGQTETLEEDERTFILGLADKQHYKIDHKILGIKHDLRLWKKMSINHQTFIANRNISIFRKIDDLIDEPIIVGGNIKNSIPIEEFELLLRNFPTTTELTHYAHARITRVLRDFFDTMSDAQKLFEAYLKRKKTIPSPSRTNFLRDYESRKYEYVRDELQNMLKNIESYAEKDWQKLILRFLLLIFPKYITVLESLKIKDFYSNPETPKNRYIDLTLVDSNGNIDIVEIKKPFENCLLSKNKYRDNYTPREELSGSVMQVEKYIFHLSKWGRDGEQEISKKRQSELPPYFKIKITNPKALIILGRDVNFKDDQKFDFEIMKRKYANVIDIMTYDDLLSRLDNIIVMMNRNYAKLGNTG